MPVSWGLGGDELASARVDVVEVVVVVVVVVVVGVVCRHLLDGPPLGPGGEDITWPDQVAPRAGLEKTAYIYTRNVYIRVPYRENTIQYASAGGATDCRQTRVPPQRMRLRTNKTRDFHVSADCRHLACTKILTVDPRHIALK